MVGKLVSVFLSGSNRTRLQVGFWGKSHMELGADAQFVRFSFTVSSRPFALNNI
jgi:hypothetical protein